MVVLGAVIFVACKEHKAAQEYERDREARCAIVFSSPQQQDTCKHERDSPNNYLPWWYVLVAWPEGITTWAVIATGGFIAWQGYETRKAANASADAANAAYGSVTYAEAQWELMKEKERARLDVKSGGSLEVDRLLDLWGVNATIRLRNIGSSRAFIVRSAGAMIIKDEGGTPVRELNDFETLTFPDQFLDPNNAPIEIPLSVFPNGSTSQKNTISEIADELHAGRKTIHLYGFVEYDTLGMRFRKDFGYIWKSFGNLSGLVGMLGDTGGIRTAEQRIADGYWTTDPERDRPEYAISRDA